MQFQSFSLTHKKMLVNSNAFTTNSSDILLKGALSAELFLLIDNLDAFSTTVDHEFLVSINKIDSVCGLSFTVKSFNKFMREACDLSVIIDMKNKKGFAAMIDEIKMSNNGSISFKINQSFEFLRKSGAFHKLYLDLPFKYNTLRPSLPEIGQQIMLIA